MIHVFIYFIRSLLQSLVSRNFLVLLRYSFYNLFLLFLLVWYYPLLIFPDICTFPFLKIFYFSDCVVLSLRLFLFFLFSSLLHSLSNLDHPSPWAHLLTLFFSCVTLSSALLSFCVSSCSLLLTTTTFLSSSVLEWRSTHTHFCVHIFYYFAATILHHRFKLNGEPV